MLLLSSNGYHADTASIPSIHFTVFAAEGIRLNLHTLVQLEL